MVNSNTVTNKDVVSPGMPAADAANPGKGKKRKRGGGLKISRKAEQQEAGQDGSKTGSDRGV